MTEEYPDPPDKPPAETFADAAFNVDGITLSDPEHEDAWISADRMVHVGDRR